MSSDNRQLRFLLDDLFREVNSFRHASEVEDLFNYCIKMQHLSAYNASLVYIQQPGNQLVLTPQQWYKEGRQIKPNARPLVILMPFCPVSFVYDISDTLPIEDTPDEAAKQKIIERYINQCDINSQEIAEMCHEKIKLLVENMPIFGVKYEYMEAGNRLMANIRPYYEGVVEVPIKRDFRVNYSSLFWIGLNKKLDDITQFTSLCHELGHLFCHHMPMEIKSTIFYRHRPMPNDIEEFEAESVAYLVCRRLGITNRSAEYLSGYKKNEELPTVSFENIFRAVNTIEKMLQTKMPYKEGYLYKYDSHFRKYVADKIKTYSQSRSLFP